MTWPCSAMYSTIASTCSSWYPSTRSARGTVWLTICIDPRGVAVHHQADRAGRREHTGLRVAPTVALADLVAPRPLVGGRGQDLAVVLVQRAYHVVGGRVLAHHARVAFRVAGETLVRADNPGQFGRAAIGRRRHQRGDRSSQCATPVRVVG